MKDKDLVMLTIAGLREEYHGLKSNLLARSPAVKFNELHGLLSDHDYLLNRLQPAVQTVATPQPFAAAATTAPAVVQPTIDTIQQQLQSLQLMAAQLGYQLNPVQSATPSQPQANFSSRSFNTNSRTNRGGRGNFRGNNRGSRGNRGNQANQGNRQFLWASTQNMVYGHCNRCGIGHLPSQCPNQAITSRAQPQAHYAQSEADTYTTWKPDTGANHHGTPDLASLNNSEAYYGRGYPGYPPYWSQ
ncbi:putative transcription factor interactor and regulator CCHC(Zn) family [Helianthus debilis subsp. tardiflorus]